MSNDTQKHTPGPWTFKKTLWVVTATRQGSDGVIVADLPNNPDHFYDEDCANARLIAAAPELLEALTEALSHPETLHETVYGTTKQWVTKARAAIAKAEGRA